MRRIKTVRFKMIAGFGISTLLPLLVLAAVLHIWAADSIEGNLRTSMQGTVDSISKNVEIYLQDLENITLIPYMNDNVMLALQKKKEYQGGSIPEGEIYEINRALLYELPIYFQLMRNDISELMILPEDGTVYLMSANSARYVKDYDYASQEWYEKAVKAQGRAVFIGNHSQDYISNPKAGDVFSVVRQIRDIETRETLAVVMADMDTDVLVRILNTVTFDDGVFCLILDDKNNVVCGNQKDGRAPEEAVQGTEDEIDGYFTVSSRMEETGWQVTALVPYANVYKQTRFVYPAVGAFVLLYLLLGGMLFFGFSQYITKPLERLAAAMQKVQKGDLDVVYEVESGDEIAELGENFNKMLFRINQLIEKEYKAVLAQRNMEYYALQSQIQPHFLYNILNSMVGLNRAGQKETLEKTILHLTDILRYMLSHSDRVRVDVELGIIEKYCELQKLRLGDRLEYVVTCEKEYAACLIPKLLLQPIVENAILHGIEPMAEGGVVSVLGEGVWENGIEYLEFTVADNGVGFDTAVLGAPGNVGIRNIQDRIRIVYHGAAFSIESARGVGSCVKIRIPKEELEDEGRDSG